MSPPSVGPFMMVIDYWYHANVPWVLTIDAGEVTVQQIKSDALHSQWVMAMCYLRNSNLIRKCRHLLRSLNISRFFSVHCEKVWTVECRLNRQSRCVVCTLLALSHVAAVTSPHPTFPFLWHESSNAHFKDTIPMIIYVKLWDDEWSWPKESCFRWMCTLAPSGKYG